MIHDKLRLHVAGGKGGDGLVSFVQTGRSGKSRMSADGGNGGHGGSIYLEGSNDIFDLSSISQHNEYVAQNGQRGQPKHRQGKTGQDLVIKVPLVTIVSDLEGNRVISVKHHGQKKLLVKGGEGGLGNYNFRAGREESKDTFTPGEPGGNLQGIFELRFYADVLFIGYPNAGKSSILNALTNADVKVADYPFTTIQPQLGVTSDHVTLMDFPGFIEGIAEGRGFGKSFNQHTIIPKLIAHFISLESNDVEKDYLTIRSELKDYSEQLLEKKEIIILTKSDLFTEKEIEEKSVNLKKYNTEIVIVSTFKQDSVQSLENRFRDIVKELNPYVD